MKGIILAVCGAMIAITLVVSAAPANPSGDMVYTLPETEETEYITLEETTAAIPETTIETEAVTTTLETTSSTILETISYYNVNLSIEVQDVIFAECEKYGINPAIVVAMIERESQFDRYAMGDDGRSFGLMQVQPKWHLKKMIELNCTDLFEPIKNVTVGINHLADLQNTYGDITKALVAYNAGSYTGTITNYAREIMERSNEV